MIDRSLEIAGIGLAVMSAMLPFVFPKLNRGWALAGFVSGLLLLGVAAGYLFVPSSAQTQPSIHGDCNAVGNNNSNCSTFNIEPRRLTLTNALKDKILEDLPKDKPGQVIIVAPSQDDLDTGMNIFSFIKSSGFNVGAEPTIEGNVIPAPNHPLTLANSQQSPTWALTIAPSAR